MVELEENLERVQGQLDGANDKLEKIYSTMNEMSS